MAQQNANRAYIGNEDQHAAAVAQAKALVNAPEQSDFLLVVGPSCAGKSTLLTNVLSECRDNGRHIIEGEPLNDGKNDQFPPVDLDPSSLFYNLGLKLIDISYNSTMVIGKNEASSANVLAGMARFNDDVSDPLIAGYFKKSYEKYQNKAVIPRALMMTPDFGNKLFEHFAIPPKGMEAAAIQQHFDARVWTQ